MLNALNVDTHSVHKGSKMSHHPRKYSIRRDDVCVKCKSKYHSITSFEVKDKNLILTRQCLECGHQELITRAYAERGPKEEEEIGTAKDQKTAEDQKE